MAMMMSLFLGASSDGVLYTMLDPLERHSLNRVAHTTQTICLGMGIEFAMQLHERVHLGAEGIAHAG